MTNLRFRRIPALILASAILLILTVDYWIPPPGDAVFHSGFVTLHTRSGEHLLEVAVAVTPAAWQQGMMHRRRWGAWEGMLFLFPQASMQQMWMKNTYLPLDIVFIATNDQIMHTAKATPKSLKGISSEYLVDKVLELPKGSIKRYDIQVGDRATYALE